MTGQIGLSGERVVAVGLLTERDLAILGEGFRRVYRIEEGHDFHALLAEIDRADRALRGQRPS